MADLNPMVEQQVLEVADAIGKLMEGWGFKRDMGRVWALLYLDRGPMSGADIGERLGLSSDAMSVLLAELGQWGAIKNAWVPGARSQHFEAETSTWKMVSRVLRERELEWIRAAAEQFAAADDALKSAGAGASGPDEADRVQRIAERVKGLTQLAQVGAHLIEAILEGESVDALPIKTMGELSKAVGRKPVGAP